VTADLIASLLPSELKPIAETDLNSVLADSLYAGYLETQRAAVAKLYQHDALKIPRQTAFCSIAGLSNEIVERLDRAKPLTFGEARLLPGLTPGALSTLLAYLSAQQKNF
jgi:tRNA uridine 5-carboxymethylaminomethyl modification enzyme